MVSKPAWCNYHLHDIANFEDHHHGDLAPFSSAAPISRSDFGKMPFSMPPPPFKVLNYQTVPVKRNDRRDKKFRNNNYKNNNVSPKSYDSDESCVSYSPRGTSDGSSAENKHQGNINNNYSNNNNNSSNNNNYRTESYGRYSRNSSNAFEPNLYQPHVNYGKSKPHSHGPNNHHPHHRRNRQQFRDPKDTTDIISRRAHGLMERFKSRAYKLNVDPSPPESLKIGTCERLNREIWDVFVTKIEKEDVYIEKLNFWKDIFLFIRGFLNNYGLFLVGSTMSGFAIQGSDIDMCLLTKPYFVSDPRVDSVHHLTQLRLWLLRTGIASEAELIMAKVPILKFKNKESGFEIDLNCNNSVGIRNTHLLHCYAQLDWRVRPLVIMVKLWAQANNINDAKNMTISSYSWALMVIHFLQCGVTPPVLPCLHGLVPEKFNSECESMDVQEELELVKDFVSDNKSSLGDLLIFFFRYYSFFDYSQYAISVRAGSRVPIDECRYLKAPKNDPHQWKWLCIEEPFDFSNAARSVFDMEAFKRIKDVILASYKELAQQKTLACVLPVNLNNYER